MPHSVAFLTRMNHWTHCNIVIGTNNMKQTNWNGHTKPIVHNISKGMFTVGCWILASGDNDTTHIYRFKIMCLCMCISHLWLCNYNHIKTEDAFCIWKIDWPTDEPNEQTNERQTSHSSNYIKHARNVVKVILISDQSTLYVT